MYKLKQLNQRLVLIDDQDPKSLGNPISVDFVDGALRHRIDYGGGKNQLLARAIGCHKHPNLHVIDATAGLGKDSFVLAHLGCHITALERNADIHALLCDGIKRGIDANISTLERITLHHSEALPYLQQLPQDSRPDVIYLDPMYPHNNKSALVKKDMRILREVVGDNDDDLLLLNSARQAAKYRIVVKRPLHAPHYANQAPNFDYKGKRSRFDVYLPQATT